MPSAENSIAGPLEDPMAPVYGIRDGLQDYPKILHENIFSLVENHRRALTYSLAYAIHTLPRMNHAASAQNPPWQSPLAKEGKLLYH